MTEQAEQWQTYINITGHSKLSSQCQWQAVCYKGVATFTSKRKAIAALNAALKQRYPLGEVNFGASRGYPEPLGTSNKDNHIYFFTEAFDGGATAGFITSNPDYSKINRNVIDISDMYYVGKAPKFVPPIAKSKIERELESLE